MRKTVLVPVQHTFCDAHIARDGSEVEAAETLTLGRHTWDLCLEHNVIFGRYLVDALGVPAEGEAVATVPEPLPVAEPAPVADPEPEAEHEEATEPEPVRSVMLAGEVPGYDWDTAREAVRNLGYEVVGRADESTVLLILGEGGERNASKLTDAAERGIPCMDVREPGRFKAAVRSGELVGGDPLPEPAKVGRSGMSDRERNRVIRAWARENGWPSLPVQGRVPMNVRHAYNLAHLDTSEGKAAAA
ncbi:Lsr2 family protein [Streptomyces sp. ISL-98]|uniref:Lsr2 family DNA-binding protein n=1 Tax=Streptomyces sp. ISL-98 TaxID=2819192 RepID=UPI001BEBC27C|nr:Lsr2 family protein [Streptomyces sp. ISL-98]MBT2508089.1 Lsr2 family protein [Streptomyces sp. ISL-98]